jgi:hypothetical protein
MAKVEDEFGLRAVATEQLSWIEDGVANSRCSAIGSEQTAEPFAGFDFGFSRRRFFQRSNQIVTQALVWSFGVTGNGLKTRVKFTTAARPQQTTMVK